MTVTPTGGAPVLRPSDAIQRTVRGAVALGGGQVAAQVLNIGGTILLARILTQAEFGLFAILTFFLAFLTALGDLGLGMSLVRQPTEPSDEVFRVVSTFQRVVAVVVALAALAVTPLVVAAYDLAPGQWWLLPVMGIAILADSVRFLPLTKLERHLVYERVGLVEVVQAVVFNIVLLSLAMAGYRTTCFPIAVVARSTVGAALAVAIGPRLSGWSWQWNIVREYLSFALPFRGVHLITVVRTAMVPVFIGLLLGRAAVGRLEWAAMVAGFPLTGLILLERLYIGSFSRLRAHPAELRSFVGHVVALAHAVVAPVAVLTLVLIDPIVRLVFGEQWVDAIPLVFWLWLGCLLIPTLAPLRGLLHAFGMSRVVFIATLIGSIATWIVGVPLVLWLGEVGAAVASLSVHVAGAAVWVYARRAVSFRALGPATLTWVSAVPAGVLAWWWNLTYPIGAIPQLFLCGVVAAAVYVAVLGITGMAFVRPVREALVVHLRRPIGARIGR